MDEDQTECCSETGSKAYAYAKMIAEVGDEPKSVDIWNEFITQIFNIDYNDLTSTDLKTQIQDQLPKIACVALDGAKYLKVTQFIPTL